MGSSVALEFSLRTQRNNKLRRNGKIPAVVYGRKDAGVSIELDAAEYDTIMRNMTKGHLPNTVFVLKGNGQELKVLVKDVHYHKVTYDVIHLDFMRLYDDVMASVNVPIKLKGVDSCVGVKAGGVLRQVKRHLRVKCLPKDLPSSLEIDVADIPMNGSARLSKVTIPAEVTCSSNPLEVIAVVGKR